MIRKWNAFLAGKELTQEQRDVLAKLRVTMLENGIGAPATNVDDGIVDMQWWNGPNYVLGSVYRTGEVEWLEQDRVNKTCNGTEDKDKDATGLIQALVRLARAAK